MTFLCAINDKGGWGKDVVAAAARRGWRTQLYNEAKQISEREGYAFFRIHQHPVAVTRHDKRQAGLLVMAGLKPIPDITQVRLYDDKLAQSEWPPMVPFMPQTIVARSRDQALFAARSIGLPIISKAAAGSASQEVRLLRSEDDVDGEIARAFGDGIRGRYSEQRGYVIFQKFLERNEYDYRVCVIGRQRMMLRRMNRSASQPFASGSGKCIPITTLDAETEAVLDVSERYFRAMNTHWCGIDLVKDAHGDWKVLETTLAWTQKAYRDCLFFGTQRRGAEIWDVLIDEIEAGVFD